MAQAIVVSLLEWVRSGIPLPTIRIGSDDGSSLAVVLFDMYATERNSIINLYMRADESLPRSIFENSRSFHPFIIPRNVTSRYASSNPPPNVLGKANKPKAINP